MKTYFKTWMNENRYTVEEVSKVTNISPKIIQKWIDGETTPSISHLNAFVEKYDTSLDELVYGIKRPEAMLDSTTDCDPGDHLVIKTHLKEWLDTLQITVEDVFRKIGTPKEIIVEWIDNKRNPSILQIEALAKSMGLTIDTVINQTPEEYYGEMVKTRDLDVPKYTDCVRIQRYLRKNKIKCYAIRLITKNKVFFRISYERDTALSVTEILAATCILNKDPREKYSDSRRRYKGISTIDFSDLI